MSKEKFTDRNFSAKSLTLIDQANKIVGEYQEEGFMLTLRQLYYQMVARDIIENTVNSYKRLGSVITDARLAGLVDWSALEGRTVCNCARFEGQVDVEMFLKAANQRDRSLFDDHAESQDEDMATYDTSPKHLAVSFGLVKGSPPHKIVLIYFDEDAGAVKARFEMKDTGEQFTRDESDLILRIQNGKRTGLDVRVEETALHLLQRMTTLIKEGYYK